MFQHLVDTSWLQAHLADPDLRILDCTVVLRAVAGGVRPEPAREQWAQAHIPGAEYADLLSDLSDRTTHLPIMMPPEAQFAEAMASYGVGDDSRVVLYDTGMSMWAARVWWMLRAFGFDQAAILDGGFKKWTAEGRLVESGATAPPQRAHFTARPRPTRIADWKEVLAAMGSPEVRLLNALSAEEHAGNVTRVARAGHIPGSTNVPATALIDPQTNAYRDLTELRVAFEKAGLLNARRVITYCGGGIAACSDAFVLTLLGAPDVAVYDGSLVEWSAQPELPLETAEP